MVATETQLQSYKATKLQSYKATKQQSNKATKLQSCKAAKLQSHKAKKLQIYKFLIYKSTKATNLSTNLLICKSANSKAALLFCHVIHVVYPA